MSEPTLLIVGPPNGKERRRRGRPLGSKAAEPGSSLTAWVPEKLHDKAIAEAVKRDMSLSEWVREVLTLTIGVDDR